jgi:hypothetical protein
VQVYGMMHDYASNHTKHTKENIPETLHGQQHCRANGRTLEVEEKMLEGCIAVQLLV